MAQLPYLFVPSVTWELLGPSEPPYGHSNKSRRCSSQSLFFHVPVGMEEGVATVPNRILRGEAASWRNCHLFVPSVTWEFLGPSEPPPMSTARNLDGAAAKVCSSLSLLVWKKVLQQFQTGYYVKKPRHVAAIAICLSQVSLGSSWAYQNRPLCPQLEI